MTHFVNTAVNYNPGRLLFQIVFHFDTVRILDIFSPATFFRVFMRIKPGPEVLKLEFELRA
jgi:hypothetical protein